MLQETAYQRIQQSDWSRVGGPKTLQSRESDCSQTREWYFHTIWNSPANTNDPILINNRTTLIWDHYGPIWDNCVQTRFSFRKTVGVSFMPLLALILCTIKEKTNEPLLRIFPKSPFCLIWAKNLGKIRLL